MTTPAPPRKPSYRTFVAEQHVAAPRDVVWSQLIALLDAGEIGPASGRGPVPAGAEETLSLEPPWRRVARLHIDGVPLAEHTIALRDDTESCHLVWAYVIEPPSAEAASGADDEFERVLGQLSDALRASCRHVALAVEQG